MRELLVFSFGNLEHPRMLDLRSILSPEDHSRRQVILMNDLTTALLRCDDLDEIFFQELQVKFQALLPDTIGALFLYRQDDSDYELVATWEVPGQPIKSGSLVSNPEGLPLNSVQIDSFELRCPLIFQGRNIGMLATSGIGNDPSGDNEQMFLAAADVVSLVIANFQLRAKLKEQVIKDFLTGMFNRRYLEQVLADEIRHAGRTGKPLSLITADIDHFKLFNDRYGHEAGDKVLEAIGCLMNSTFRVRDIPCRYGGEEFLIVLPETNLVSAAIRAERLVGQVRQLKIDGFSGSTDTLTISVGVAAYPEHGEVVQDLIRRADEALYEAKGHGRNRVALASA